MIRCAKTIKNSNESEYRVLLDNFMEDVITVLNFPEWPAAEMIVHIFSKIMVTFIRLLLIYYYNNQFYQQFVRET